MIANVLKVKDNKVIGDSSGKVKKIVENLISLLLLYSNIEKTNKLYYQRTWICQVIKLKKMRLANHSTQLLKSFPIIIIIKYDEFGSKIGDYNSF